MAHQSSGPGWFEFWCLCMYIQLLFTSSWICHCIAAEQLLPEQKARYVSLRIHYSTNHAPLPAAFSAPPQAKPGKTPTQYSLALGLCGFAGFPSNISWSIWTNPYRILMLKVMQGSLKHNLRFSPNIISTHGITFCPALMDSTKRF